MLIASEAVKFKVLPCHNKDCLLPSEGGLVVSISQIQEAGWPVCSQCGADLDVADVAIVTTLVSNNSMDRKEQENFAEKETDIDFDDGEAWGSVYEYNLLWANSLNDEELNDHMKGGTT